MTPDQILDGAVREIEKRGWGRRRLINPDNGTVCLKGACYCTVELGRNVKSHLRALWVLTAEIEDQTGVTTIASWNDGHCKDQDEAIYMLQAAAKRARAEAC